MNKYSLIFLPLSRAATPAISGIVANDWFDRETGKSVTSEPARAASRREFDRLC
jgi:hypothetical protein